LVHRSKFETLKSILTSEYWLVFSLAGVFFCFFALGSGANFFLNLTGIFLVIELLLGNYRIKQIPRWYLVVAAICAYLVLASVLNPYAYSKVRYIKRLMRMVIVVFAIHCLSQKDIEDRITVLFGGMLALAVCWQFAAHSLYNMPFGTYANRHYLSSFAALALPLFICCFLVTADWYKFIFVPVAILDVYLLLQTGPRTALFAILCGGLFVSIFLGKGWYRWLCLFLMFTLVSVLYISDYPIAISEVHRTTITLKNLIRTIPTEERIYLWAATWKMQKDNTLIGWVMGNGIGSFRLSFPEYLAPPYRSFIFPHSYFLEILYENGIIGFSLVFGGLGCLFYSAMIKTRNIVNKRMSILLKCILMVFVIWFINSNLIFPFYSNYSLIPLAFIMGTMLVLVGEITGDETPV